MKKYKCIGKKEKAATYWANYFTIGEVYEAAPKRLARAPAADNTLFLFDMDKDNLKTWFVDKDQFEECTS